LHINAYVPVFILLSFTRPKQHRFTDRSVENNSWLQLT